jgi:ABC-type multidrug transport system fused ATPase/permease subunit
LQGLDDDILTYVTGVVEDMSPAERRTAQALINTVAPFLVDSEFCDQAKAASLCQSLSVSFGGSGSLSAKLTSQQAEDDPPPLLAAPVRIAPVTISAATVKPAVDIDGDGHSGESESTSMQRQFRKNKRQSDDIRKAMLAQQAAEEAFRQEMANARMAAIMASRTAGRQCNSGVSIDRFSLPHPSGTGDLLSDASLVLSSGRRCGLVGKNGAGKTTLMKAIATYKLPGLGVSFHDL